MMKTVLTIKGTHCASCKALIEEVCREVPGVTACTVDFKTGKAVIEHAASLDLMRVKKEIDSLGPYKVVG
jgi:copper chaperone CopZ